MFLQLLYDKDRYFDRMSHVLNGLAVHNVAEAAVAVSGHYDEIRLLGFGKADDLVRRRIRVANEVFALN